MGCMGISKLQRPESDLAIILKFLLGHLEKNQTANLKREIMDNDDRVSFSHVCLSDYSYKDRMYSKKNC